MSCILYSYPSYKLLFNSPCIKQVNKELSVHLDARSLYMLNEAAYKARYADQRDKTLFSEQEPIDYEFENTDFSDPISVYKLLERIDYQCCDIHEYSPIYQQYADDYDTFQYLRFGLVDQIIDLAHDYRRRWLQAVEPEKTMSEIYKKASSYIKA